MNWKRLVRRRQTDADLQKEIAAFLDEETADNIARGLSLEEARRQAYIKVGNPQRAREDLRAQNTIPIVKGVWRDLVYAGRMLSRSPGFAATAILTLAIALAANTAVFSLVNSLLLRPLPVPHTEELAVLRWASSQASDLSYNFSAPMFRALEKRHDAFQTLGAFSGNVFQVRGSSGNVEITATLVSGDFFRTLGTQPLLGRYLTPRDDQPGGTTNGFTAVISQKFWHSWFNSAPDVIGRRLIIDNAPFTVVGVMPSRFIGADPTRRSEIYAPLWAEPVIDAPYNVLANGYKSLWLRVIARRRRGLSLAVQRRHRRRHQLYPARIGSQC